MGNDNQNKNEDQLLGSFYDGIQEYDNDLPRWWVQLFYLTIGFAAVYAVYIHLLGTPSDLETLRAEIKVIQQAQARLSKESELKGEGSLQAALKNPKAKEQGRAVFVAKCAACHGQNAEGLVGPNLTDEFWIHGGSAEAIHKTVVEGVANKGMISWRGVISEEDINSVTVYIYSLKGTNLPGKAPEGEKG